MTSQYKGSVYNLVVKSSIPQVTQVPRFGLKLSGKSMVAWPVTSHFVRAPNVTVNRISPVSSVFCIFFSMVMVGVPLVTIATAAANFFETSVPSAKLSWVV